MNLAVFEKTRQMSLIKVHNVFGGPAPEQTNPGGGRLEAVLYFAEDRNTRAMHPESSEFVKVGGVGEQPVCLSPFQKREAVKDRRAHAETVAEPPDELNPARCVDESWPGRIPPS